MAGTHAGFLVPVRASRKGRALIVTLVALVVAAGAGGTLRSPLIAHATSDAVTLYQPTTLHANGAELAWSAYTGPSGAGFVDYEVHRSLTPGFTPSAADLLTTIYDQSTTWFTDTTAAPGVTFAYVVVASSSPSNEVDVTLPPSGQSTAVLQPASDTFIASGSSYLGCENFGAADPILVGSDATDTFRSLLNFDLSGVPVGATINGARLSMYHAATALAGGTLQSYPVTTSWRPGAGNGTCTGGGASWFEGAGTGSEWSSGGGGDYDASSPGGTTTVLPGELTGWDTVDVSSTVQSWTNGSRPKLGVLLRMSDETRLAGQTIAYTSSKDPNAALLPKLAVTYTDGTSATAPTVSVVTPVAGSYVRGTGVTVSAVAAAADGRIAHVDFVLDGSVIGTATTAPYSITWNTTRASNGAHTLTARAYDDASNVGTSSAVSLTVANYAPTTVQIDYPATATVLNPLCTMPAVEPRLDVNITACSYAWNASGQGVVPIAATTTTDSNVTVQKVVFFVDGVRVGTSTAPPYTMAWNTLDASHPTYDGVHTLTAEAWDSTGVGTMSGPVQVTIHNTQLTVQDGTGATTTASTEFQAGFATSGVSTTLTYDPSLTTQAAYPVTVTVSNRSPQTWPQSDVFLHYRWYTLSLPNTVTDGPAVPLGQDVGPGQTVTVTVSVAPPTLAPGQDSGDYRLQFDLNDASYTAGGPAYGLAQAASLYCSACNIPGFAVESIRPQTPGIWFASMGNAPAESSAHVVSAGIAGGVGTPPYYQFLHTHLGAGVESLVNVASGNSVVHLQPFSDPGRGLATVVDLTYNSRGSAGSEAVAGNNWSLSMSSLTDQGVEMVQSGNHLLFTGGDGTPHEFDRSSGDPTVFTERAGDHLYVRQLCQTATQCGSQALWQNPMFKVTRPDRVSYTYNPYGYPLAVTDRHGNTLTYTLPAPADDNSNAPDHYTQIASVSDAGGRSFTLTYWTKHGDGAEEAVVGKVKRIADHSGHGLDFSYYDDGNLLSLTEEGGSNADRTPLAARTWAFTYTDSNGQPAIPAQAKRWAPDPATNGETSELFSIIDPIGEATHAGHETTFGYCKNPAGNCSASVDQWNLESLTDRAGNQTTFAYTPESSSPATTTVTAPLGRTTTSTYDGRATDAQAFLVTKITDPLGQVRDVEWTADNEVARLSEPRHATDGVFSSPYTLFAYDSNGSLTDRCDPREAWAASTTAGACENGDRISLTYAHVPIDSLDVSGNWQAARTISHADDVLTKTDASGYTWQFGYSDSNDTSITSIQDPTQTATARTTLAYNADGTVATSSDGDGHVTTDNAYDPSGQPTKVTDAAGNVAQVSYDVDGRTLALQDPRHANCTANTGSSNPLQFCQTQLAYDSFHRLGEQSTTVSSGSQQLVWRETTYDADNNVVAQSTPHFSGATDTTSGVPATTASYDAMDRTVEAIVPDTSADPAGQRTQYGYDAAGRLLRVVLPIGTKDGTTTAAPTGSGTAWNNVDHAIDFTYDALSRVLVQTQYMVTGTDQATPLYTDSCYSLAGDLVRSTAPQANVKGENCAAAAPGYTTSRTYGANHRLLSSQDAQGDLTQDAYNPNGTRASVTDARGNVTTYTYDGRGRTLTQSDPFSPASNCTPGTGCSHVTTQSCYDAVGNQLRTLTPRALGYGATCTSSLTPGATGYAPYVTSDVYDADNRLAETDLPTDSAHTEQDRTFQRYDPTGNVTLTTLASSATCAVTDQTCASVPVNDRTTTTYFDPGWIASTSYGGRVTKADGQTTASTTVVCAPDANFSSNDIGQPIGAPGSATTSSPAVIAAYTTIVSLSAPSGTVCGNNVCTSATCAVMSQAATAAASNLQLVIGPRSGASFGYGGSGCKTVCALGKQTSRSPLVNGLPSKATSEAWSYLPEGTLQTHSESVADTSVPDGTATYTYAYDADNDVTSSTSTTDAPKATVLALYDSLDRLARSDGQVGGVSYDFTAYAYNLDGSTVDSCQDGAEPSAPTTAPTSFSCAAPGHHYGYEYDQREWLTDQCSDPAASAPRCAAVPTGTLTVSRPQLKTTTYLPTGLITSRQVAQASGTAWSTVSTTSWGYNGNGTTASLSTATPQKGTVESHTVGYTDGSGVYLDGNRTSDQYQLAGANTSCATSPCTATYSYDPRDRVDQESDGHGDTTTYTLNAEGDLTTQQTTGQNPVASTYAGTQLQTQAGASGQEQKFFYDGLGRLRCVTDANGTGATCGSVPGATSSNPYPASTSSDLLRLYSYDFQDQLTTFQSYNGSSGANTQTTTYQTDALQRTTTETQHDGQPSAGLCAQTTSFTYLGLSSNATQEAQQNSGAVNGSCGSTASTTDTKTYSFDASGTRLSLSDSQAGTTYTYGYDVHGSTSLLINDSTGGVQATYAFSAYGQTDSTVTQGDPASATQLNAYRYQAQRYDSGSGTDVFGARRFGPDISHFLQQDYFQGAFADLGLSLDPLTQNRYALSGGNPVNLADPTGHRACADEACYQYTMPQSSTPHRVLGSETMVKAEDAGFLRYRDDLKRAIVADYAQGSADARGAGLQQLLGDLQTIQGYAVGGTVGVFVGGLCSVATGGIGDVSGGCVVLGGAAGGAASGQMQCGGGCAYQGALDSAALAYGGTPPGVGGAFAADSSEVGSYLAGKAPTQVEPGINSLQGQYVNDMGRVEPWTAHYDEYGRLIGRTDYNAGNAAQGIPDIHYHTYEYGPGYGNNGMETGSHIPGEYQP